MESTIVRAKISGRYRRCELLFTRGRRASLRLLPTNPGVEHIKENWEMSLSFIHPDDRHLCVDPDYTDGAHTVTFLRDISFHKPEGKALFIRADKQMTLSGVLLERGYLIVFSEKHGELRIPENAVRIEKL